MDPAELRRAPEIEGALSDDVRPVVVVSQCLGFGPVRYNGQVLRSRFVDALRGHVDFVQVCPEVGIGLGVPRDPVRLVDDEGRLRMIQPATQRDVTEAMDAFSADFLVESGTVDGFILKGRSPSCGIRDVKIHASADGPSRSRGTGLFARHVRDRFPLAPVEDEGRLTNLPIRHHFLASLFTVARFRSAREEGNMAALVRFQTEHKLLLMAHGAESLRRLGQITAGAHRGNAADAFANYADLLGPLLRRQPGAGAVVNVLQHAFGYLSDGLKPRERKYFLRLTEEYRRDQVPLAAVLAVLQAWIARVQEPYLETQRFFSPYPRELLDLTDSGATGRR